MAFIRLSLILSLLMGNMLSFAQSVFLSNKYIESSWYFGSVLPQNNTIRYLVHGHLSAFQLNAGFNTYGSREWHQYLHYPRLGVGYYHSNLGNDEVFGYVNAFYGTAALKTFPQKYFINLEHNLTAGIGILTRHYDLYKNPLNQAFGGPVVFFLQYALLVPVRLNPSFELYAGPCFTHTSVGKIIQPNLGLHMLQVRVGGRYNFKPVVYKNEFERKPLAGTSRHQITLVAATGMKQYSRLTPKKSSLFVLSPEYSFKLSHVFGVGGGFDFYLDNSVKPYMLENFNKRARFEHIFHSTAQVALSLYIGNLDFVIQPGTYLYQKFEDDHGLFIYKLGFRYHITDRYSAGVLLKAHWLAKADFLEFGVGYSFLKNEKKK
jgi:hypothetical protein